MNIVSFNKRVVIPAVSSTTIDEYHTNDKTMSVAVATIHGRYPLSGFAHNTISNKLVYVTKGKGAILSPTENCTISEGDVIHLDPNELFAQEGNITIVMVTSPPFDSKQHIITL